MAPIPALPYDNYLEEPWLILKERNSSDLISPLTEKLLDLPNQNKVINKRVMYKITQILRKLLYSFTGHFRHLVGIILILNVFSNTEITI